jgi:transposase InsO family protein
MVGFLLRAFLYALLSPFRSRIALQTEILALRHQLAVYQRTCARPHLKPADRILWAWVSRIWAGWRDTLVIVQPKTVIAWRRRKFREHWIKLTRSGKPGRPAVAKEVRDLIRRLSAANSLWGSPRILGELRKIGINVAKSTVEKYMVRHRKPPSPTWRAFLNNHAKAIVAIDFFVVPTVRHRILHVFLVLTHDRRRVLHFNVTTNPTAEWTAQQIVEAFPWEVSAKYLLRDRDKIYGETFQKRVRNMGFEEVLTAPRSPWQNPYVERLIGSIRRECLDHVIVLNERHLRRVLTSYFGYYHRSRTHLSLEMDCPEHREVHGVDGGRVIELPDVDGLHHHYERRAA